jgi:branched-chain amino acid transport system permease protein
MRIANPRNLAGAIAAVVLLALAPLVFRSTYLVGVLTISVIYGIWAVSWDFMSGLTGRENFGHALFIGAGAYTAGFLNTVWLANPWWSLPASMIVAMLFSILVGLPTLRLKGPYFALAMLRPRPSCNGSCSSSGSRRAARKASRASCR